MVTDRLHQFGHVGLSVVAGHVGMEVLPDALDLVMVGTVGGQEVQLDLARQVAAQEDPLIRDVSSDADAVRAYEVAGGYEMNVAGLLRYLAKRAG